MKRQTFSPKRARANWRPGPSMRPACRACTPKDHVRAGDPKLVVHEDGVCPLTQQETSDAVQE